MSNFCFSLICAKTREKRVYENEKLYDGIFAAGIRDGKIVSLEMLKYFDSLTVVGVFTNDKGKRVEIPSRSVRKLPCW